MADVKKQCPEFSFFGANYPDATCIDGYLWDLDSCDEPGGPLYSGGEAACPFCNAEEAAQNIVDGTEGYEKPIAIEQAKEIIKRFQQKHGANQ